MPLQGLLDLPRVMILVQVVNRAMFRTHTPPFLLQVRVGGLVLLQFQGCGLPDVIVYIHAQPLSLRHDSGVPFRLHLQVDTVTRLMTGAYLIHNRLLLGSHRLSSLHCYMGDSDHDRLMTWKWSRVSIRNEPG